MSTVTLKAVHDELAEVMKHTDVIIDEMTGRNTYPLIDESAQPFDLYIAIEVERIRGAVSHLKDNIHNELITRGDSYDEYMAEYWTNEREEKRAAEHVEKKNREYVLEQLASLRKRIMELEDGPEKLV